MEQAPSRGHTPGGAKHQHSIHAHIGAKSTFFHSGCTANARLPGSLEGVQGTELATYPRLVATATEGVPRR